MATRSQWSDLLVNSDNRRDPARVNSYSRDCVRKYEGREVKGRSVMHLTAWVARALQWHAQDEAGSRESAKRQCVSWWGSGAGKAPVN